MKPQKPRVGDYAMTTADIGLWLDEVLPKHQRLTSAVQSLLENMLQKRQVAHLTVTSRVKGRDDILEKIRRKDYSDPKAQLTDISGIRIITYLEEQVVQISNLVRDIFDIDEQNSLDRSADLGHDKMGYRSTHFVCSLGKKRDALPEYDSLGGLTFEIQVRTVLQHAWAELAHDRSFKFGIALPTKIQRKLNLYSGLLEIVDNAFDEISKEIDAYREELERKSVNQISDAGLDSISITKYLSDVEKTNGVEFEAKEDIAEAIEELLRFDVKTIGDLEKLMTGDFVQKHAQYIGADTATGFLRSAMMYADLKRYFQVKPTWSLLPQGDFDFLATKYESEAINKVVGKHGIIVADVGSRGLKRRLRGGSTK